MDYRVDLDTFRGPLDLLLYLVKREEVDIRDIPIARITEQYLHHLEVLQLIDVERVGDFLVMASTLMEIKSKLLLPRGEGPPADTDDPRHELVRQLMEYKKYKDAAVLLEERVEQQAARLPRQAPERPHAAADPAAQPLRQVELWDLVSAFSRLMRETLATAPRQISYDDTPVHVYMDQVVARLSAQPRLPLADLFEPPHTRSRFVGLFLAILELIKAKRIQAEQESAFGDIAIALLPGSEEPTGFSPDDPGSRS